MSVAISTALKSWFPMSRAIAASSGNTWESPVAGLGEDERTATVGRLAYLDLEADVHRLAWHWRLPWLVGGTAYSRAAALAQPSPRKGEAAAGARAARRPALHPGQCGFGHALLNKCDFARVAVHCYWPTGRNRAVR
jgi:hypothetical protein